MQNSLVCAGSPKRRESVLSDTHTALKDSTKVNQHYTSYAGFQSFVAETLLKIVNSCVKSSVSGCGRIAALPALGRQTQNQESLMLARSAGDPILKTKPNPKYSTLLYSI